MAGEKLGALLDELADWVDSALAVGVATVGSEQWDAARRLAGRLTDAGLMSCAEAVRAAADGDPALRTSLFGRLLVVLELAREAADLERLRQESTDEKGSPDEQTEVAPSDS